jgi:DNA-directed RNA polymerase subunit omega
MARVTVEDCLSKVNNRFELVLLVAKRAKQVLRGSQITIPKKGNKYIVSSLREVAEGNVRFDIDPTRGDALDQVEHDLNR